MKESLKLDKSRLKLNQSEIDRFLKKRELKVLRSQQKNVFKKGNRKLSEKQVSEIKYLLQNTSLMRSEIASLFNVKIATIDSIKYKKTWVYVSPAGFVDIVH